MKRFSVFFLPAMVMAGALLLFTSCKKENPAPAPAPTPTSIDLSASGTANCYIVSAPGTYSFKAVKGNSEESVGDIRNAVVVWESFGTDEVPEVGAIISSVSYADGRVSFTTPSTLKNGNAVIAVKDLVSNAINWSWHIWVCEGYDPDATGQVYYRDAGTVMDRNLGATSATPGEVGTLGLLYQWGRKDPFLGSSSISSDTKAASTITWPEIKPSTTFGNIISSIMNPTTFIYQDNTKPDWFSQGPNNTLWAVNKTIYDPCPYGWKVPAGGNNGLWGIALDSEERVQWLSDYANRGMNLSDKLGDAEPNAPIWYPACGFLKADAGTLTGVGTYEYLWSFDPNDSFAFSCYMYNIQDGGSVYPVNNSNRAAGNTVRCVKEQSL